MISTTRNGDMFFFPSSTITLTVEVAARSDSARTGLQRCSAARRAIAMLMHSLVMLGIISPATNFTNNRVARLIQMHIFTKSANNFDFYSDSTLAMAVFFLKTNIETHSSLMLPVEYKETNIQSFQRNKTDNNGIQSFTWSFRSENQYICYEPQKK